MEKLSAQENTEAVPEEFGWSAKKLEMPMLWGGFYLDSFNEHGKSSIKSQARWNGHENQVIVRAVDGFVYIINNVTKRPGIDEVLKIHDIASDMWQTWYLEEIAKPENIPAQDTTRH